MLNPKNEEKIHFKNPTNNKKKSERHVWKQSKTNERERIKIKIPPLAFLSQVLHSTANERDRIKIKIKISGSQKLYTTKHNNLSPFYPSPYF